MTFSEFCGFCLTVMLIAYALYEGWNRMSCGTMCFGL